MIGEDFRQSEVEYFDDTIRRNLDVCRFQIAMNDASFVRVVKHVGDLEGDLPGIFERQRAFGARTVHNSITSALSSAP